MFDIALAPLMIQDVFVMFKGTDLFAALALVLTTFTFAYGVSK
ncbi:hypothetical protein NCTGTJJY_CDS0080 [Serratia phage 92A1]|nr:hypothetical protein NCTGTJJY_CDS0080 [Serratia phage 92A1]